MLQDLLSFIREDQVNWFDKADFTECTLAKTMAVQATLAVALVKKCAATQLDPPYKGR